MTYQFDTYYNTLRHKQIPAVSWLAQQKIRTCNQRHSHSNVPTIPEDGVNFLQLIRFARTCRGVFKLFTTLSACSLHSFFFTTSAPT